MGAIPHISDFNKLTTREQYVDSVMNAHNVEKLAMLQEGTAFIDGVSDEDKQIAIDYHITTALRHSDNRSRYYLTSYKNGEVEYDYVGNEDTISTECTCYLSGDTIKVNMGLWVFGGFGFQFVIVGDSYSSSYWEDMHKQAVYKQHLDDTALVNNVVLDFDKRELMLERMPEYRLGEDIVGYFNFKTKSYYILKHIGLNYSESTAADMDSQQMSGSVYFKCQLRKKTIGDE